MAKFVNGFTDPNNSNAPLFRSDGENLWIKNPIFLGAEVYEYTICEDRLGSIGYWLHWGPPNKGQKRREE